MVAEHMDGDYLVRTHPNGFVERLLVSPAPPPGPDLRPRIVVTGVSSPEEIVVVPGDVTCATDTELTLMAEVRDAVTDAVLPVTQTLRMPFVARDGRERILLAPFEDGVATITTTVRESGCWQITEATINQDLPPEGQMQFAGLCIFVVQS